MARRRGPDIVIGIEAYGDPGSDWRASDYIRSPEEIAAEHARDRAELGGRVADHLDDEQAAPAAWVQERHWEEEYRAGKQAVPEREAR